MKTPYAKIIEGLIQAGMPVEARDRVHRLSIFKEYATITYYLVKEGTNEYLLTPKGEFVRATVIVKLV